MVNRPVPAARAVSGLARFVVCALVAFSGEAQARCEDVVPPAQTPSASRRVVTAEDILRLRDVGEPDGSAFGRPSPLAVSPDGRSVAFILNRADPDTNSYCRALVAVDLARPHRLRVIDRGGEIINFPLVFRGMTVPAGYPDIITPAWSPDGNWIAYLRRDNGRTQVWRARADGSESRALTRLDSDAEAVSWNPGNGRIIYAAKPAMPRELAAIEKEGRQGWLYDARFAPKLALRPMPSEIPREVFSIAPDGSDARVADDAERRVPLAPASGATLTPRAIARDGRIATVRKGADSGLLTLEIVVEGPDGRAVGCRFEQCRGRLTDVWWTPGERELLFLRREGWANGKMGLYRWSPGTAKAPVRLLETDDVLLGCVMAPAGLLCTRENATRPRHIVVIDPQTGSQRLIYDPNPEFASVALGKVERLTWRNDQGIEGRGDLVLPPGYRPGRRLPTVLVTYRSNGFLRGGTGDEYPIHPLAAAGFAVLSIENVADVNLARAGIASSTDLAREGQKGWAERWSQLSSQQTAVRLLVSRGITDPARVGISGLSNGATSVRFALLNSKMFAVASASTCCVGHQGVMTYGGVGTAKDFIAIGHPGPGADPGDFYKLNSFAMNAHRMDTPLLLQVADDEMISSLEDVTALQGARKPVEMYVFPGEHHMKWQSAHRAAIYRRNIDWFAFWLQGRIDPDPAKRDQYQRWKTLRDGPIVSPYDAAPHQEAAQVSQSTN